MAVVILFALLGWLLQHFAGVPEALLPSLLIGMLVANFVPANGSCPVPPRRPPE